MALAEIGKIKNENLIAPTQDLIEKILNSLAESSEWAQVGLLEILFTFEIED